jgi:hypothetical protein
MSQVYCDESYDDCAYALAGWIAPPLAWDGFVPAWRSMLSRFTMPDGTTMPAFHASEIVGRDEISGSRFRGWSFEQEKEAFKAAIDVIAEEPSCVNLWVVGCCAVISSSDKWITRDQIYTLLFGRLLLGLIERFQPQNGFSFLFDDKREIRDHVNKIYYAAKYVVDKVMPGKLDGSNVAFASDDEVEPLQAADLFAYEWRRRVSERVRKPAKLPRKSYIRLRECRPARAMLYCYGPEAIDVLKSRVAVGEDRLLALCACPSTKD